MRKLGIVFLKLVIDKDGLKRGKNGIRMSEWIVKHHIPSQV